MKTQPVQLLNEEDLKAKILSPYLQSLGFTVEDIELEKSFKVRLGRKEHPKSQDKAVGRLDYLCKQGDRNLFIIEAKNPENGKISQDDIDQGISYARLVHPIAPFLLVTNGKKDGTQVIDVITKEKLNDSNIELQSEFWKRGCTLSVAEDLELRYEALKYFIGYSQENLKAFSLSQIEDRMQPLKGSDKKYVPRLFLERETLVKTFSRFMETSACSKLTKESLSHLEDKGISPDILTKLETLQDREHTGKDAFSNDAAQVITTEQFELHKAAILDSLEERRNQCFALLGESGVGKTNCICNLAEQFSTDYIVLFFNAQELKSIIDSIQEDFNWIFSPQLKPPEIIRRLESLTEKAKTKVCMFFDAIDEAPYPKDFQIDLDGFVRKLKNFPAIKVCLSCKTSEWGRFLRSKGNPTYLSESLFQVSNEATEYILERFSNDELEKLEEKYKEVFNYQGLLTRKVRDECRLGFMLRVVAEVYQNKPLPEVIDNIELLRAYLNKKFEKIDDSQKAEKQLRTLGSLLIEKEGLHQNLISDLIEKYELIDRLNGEEILPELFAHNILYKVRTEEGLELIGFYYTRVMDYVVSILSLHLHTLNEEDFRALLVDMFDGSVRQSAITWYGSVAKMEHQEICQKYRASLFINAYTTTIEKHFPHLKDRFEPHTSEKIGIVINSISTGFPMGMGYGFRALKHEDSNLIEVITKIPANQDELSEEFFKLGVKTCSILIRSESFLSIDQSFLSIDPGEAARREIKEQLKAIIPEGELNEDNNIGLALEKAINILYCYGQKFEVLDQDIRSFYAKTNELFPITCDDILRKIKFDYARSYYENLQHEEFIQQGKIEPQYRGNLSIHHMAWAKFDYDEILKKAERAVQDNEDIPEPNFSNSSSPYPVLYRAINIIREKFDEISEPLLPLPDIPKKDADEKIRQQKGKSRLRAMEDSILAYYSPEQLKKYFESFFRLFIQEYKTLVETNFPTFKDYLPFYSLQPVCAYVEVRTTGSKKGQFSYGYKHIDAKETIIEVNVNPSTSKLWSLFNAGEIKTLSPSLISSIFHSSLNPIPLTSRSNYRTHPYEPAARDCAIRDWVYRKIKEELEDITKRF